MYQAFDLSSKAVLITGGNRGIGLGMAEALAQAGAAVAIWGRTAEKNEASKNHLSQWTDKLVVQQVDVSDETAVKAAMAQTISALGRLDAVFANAGIGVRASSFFEITQDAYRQVLSVNLDGVFWTLREAARHMVDRFEQGDRSGGCLAAVSSLAAIEGAARNQHYGASKGAVISMIKGCAVEFARYGVRANAILPGWIATDLTEPSQKNPAFAEKVIPRVPLRRWGRPEDFGGVAVYLASDASSYHSGDTFIIDGGYTVF